MNQLWEVFKLAAPYLLLFGAVMGGADSLTAHLRGRCSECGRKYENNAQ